MIHPFLVTPASAFGIPVCRLGLGFTGYLASTLTPDDVHHAIDRGVNFLNWSGQAEGPVEGDVLTATVSALGRARGSVVVCAQFGARSVAGAEEELESTLAVLGTDYIDVLTLYYVER